MADGIKQRIRRYQELAGIHSSTDYGSPNSVRAANLAAKEMRAIAQEIGLSNQTSIHQFGCLLDEDQNNISLWAAHHLLELMNAPELLAQRALAVIERHSNGNDARAMGERIWLERWGGRAEQG